MIFFQLHCFEVEHFRTKTYHRLLVKNKILKSNIMKFQYLVKNSESSTEEGYYISTELLCELKIVGQVIYNAKF